MKFMVCEIGKTCQFQCSHDVPHFHNSSCDVTCASSNAIVVCRECNTEEVVLHRLDGGRVHGL